MKSNIIMVLIVALVVGGGGFFGGMKYQQSKSPRSGNVQFFRNGNVDGNGQFQQRGQQGLRPVSGEIISSDDKSITVKLQDNSSKIILLDDKTTINKTDEATKEDLKTGVTVAAFGIQNSDGSVTAQNIQLNPMTFRGQMPSGQLDSQSGN